MGVLYHEQYTDRGERLSRARSARAVSGVKAAAYSDLIRRLLIRLFA